MDKLTEIIGEDNIILLFVGIGILTLVSIVIFVFQQRSSKKWERELSLKSKSLTYGFTDLIAIEFVSGPIYEYFLKRNSQPPIPEYDKFIDQLPQEIIDRANEFYMAKMYLNPPRENFYGKADNRLPNF